MQLDKKIKNHIYLYGVSSYWDKGKNNPGKRENI